MAGLFFWRKKRSSEAPALPDNELSSYESSPDTLAETTTGADELETTTGVEQLEVQAETPSVAPQLTRDKPAEEKVVAAKKPRLFKPKVKVEPVAEPESVVEAVIEPSPEPEAAALPQEELASYDSLPQTVAETTTGVDELEVVEEPEPVIEVAAPVAAPIAEPEVELEAVELPKRSFAKGIKSLFTRIKFDVENLDDLEDTLILSDFGVDASAQIVESVKQRAKKKGAKTEGDLKAILVDVLAEALEREDKQLNLADGKLPYVILVVGVNGVGKTTTIGKLANWLNEGQWRVVIGAADTFRAAAVEQIATWAERANAQLIRPDAEGQDPASVAFKTVELALKNDADVAIIDTAGRLQNKKDLMAELDKIKRVVEKQAQISETLLVLDATTGQNGLVQAKAFAEVADVTGIVLTKLDGTAKGGIVYSIQRELGIPVKLVGVGEGIADFAFFDAREFAKGLVG